MSYQKKVGEWMKEVFPPEVVNNIEERNLRFIEESVELVQSFGLGKEQVLKIVEYVYGRPKGEPGQEVGGVKLTLAALCNAALINMKVAGNLELDRVWLNIDKIREKQKFKQEQGVAVGPIMEYANKKRRTAVYSCGCGLAHYSCDCIEHMKCERCGSDLVKT